MGFQTFWPGQARAKFFSTGLFLAWPKAPHTARRPYGLLGFSAWSGSGLVFQHRAFLRLVGRPTHGPLGRRAFRFLARLCRAQV